MKYIICREGNPHAERAVKVVRHRDGKSWWVNPEALVFRATTVSLRRDYCILSFAQGLKAAGHSVVMKDQRDGHVAEAHNYTQTGPISLIFWLVGFAWGRKQWIDLVHAMQRCVLPDQYLVALERTADYYYSSRRRRCEELRIILPI